MRRDPIARLAYDAFISYSHDAGALASALTKGLATIARPWWARRALRIFCDETALSATPHLWDTIEAALASSRWLVVMASAQGGTSQWVLKEVAWWLEHRSAETILLAIANGSISWGAGGFTEDSTALPAILHRAFATEPLWVDLRWACKSQDMSPSNLQLRRAVARLAAPIHGVPLDEIEGEDLAHQRWRNRIIGATALIMLGLAGLSFLLARSESRQRVAAQRSTAASLVERAAGAVRERDWRMAAALFAAARVEFESPLARFGAAIAGARLLEPISEFQFTSAVEALAFSPDGQRVAVGLEHAGKVPVLDTSTGDRAGELPAPHVFSVAWAPDGSAIATVGKDGYIRLFDASTFGPLRSWSCDGREDGERSRERMFRSGVYPDVEVPGQRPSVRFSPDGRRLVAAIAMSAVVIDLTTGRHEARLDHSEFVWAAGLGPGAFELATASGGEVRYWSAPDRELRVDRIEPISALEPAHRESWFAVGDVFGGLRMLYPDPNPYGLQPGPKLAAAPRRAGARSAVTALAISPDDHLVAFGTEEGHVEVVDRRTGSTLASGRCHSARVQALAFTGDDRLATGGLDQVVRFWRLPSDDTFRIEVSGGVSSVAAAIDDTTIAVVGDVVDLCDGRTGALVRRVTVGSHPSGATVSRDAAVVAVAGSDGAWLVQQGRTEQLQPSEHAGQVAVSPDGEWVAWSNKGSKAWETVVYLRRTAGGPAVAFGGHVGRVTALAFSPDGQRLATACEDGKIRLRATAGGGSGTELKHGDGLSSHPLDLAFAPDGRRLVSAGSGSVTLWDLATGTARRVDHGGERVAFTPEGLLLTAGDGRLTAWDLDLCRPIFELEHGSLLAGALAASNRASRLFFTARDGVESLPLASGLSPAENLRMVLSRARMTYARGRLDDAYDTVARGVRGDQQPLTAVPIEQVLKDLEDDDNAVRK